MAHRKRNRSKKRSKLRLKKPSPEALFAIFIIIIGIISLFSVLGLTKSPLEELTEPLINFWGWGILIFPFLSITLGLIILNIEIIQIKLPQLIGLSSSLIFILGISSGINYSSGGILGNWVFRQTNQIFTQLGAILVLLIATLISLQISLKISLKKLSEKLTLIRENFQENSFLQSTAEKIKQKREIAAAQKVIVEENSQNNDEKNHLIQESDQTKTKTKDRAITQEITLEEETRSEKTEENKLVSPDSSPDGSWQYPPISLLTQGGDAPADRGDIDKNSQIIKQTLKSFGIETNVAEVNLGPTVTQYALELSEGTSISKVTARQNDLALALAAPTGTIRIEAPIPGRSLIGVEVPNYSSSKVSLYSVITAENMKKQTSRLAIPLGHDVAGQPVIAKINKWPHVLIAGATGSGKSVLLHTIVSTLLFRNSPDEVKTIMVDPKRVELTQYDGIPHLLTPVITQVDKVISALKWAISEMETRYEKFQQVKVRDIDSYNQAFPDNKIYHIIILVDELADIMAYAANEIERLICRLAQMSRATGIHLVLSTQRPSVDVLTGLIKANIPTRIALNVASSTDSRVILDSVGAEKLLGKGDMLYLPPDRAKPIRIQGVFVSPKEIRNLIKFITEQKEQLDLSDNETNTGEIETTATSVANEMKQDIQINLDKIAEEQDRDPLFKESVRVILNNKRASASLLQRRLSIGYARAARILDDLEFNGLISPKDGSKPREVYAEKVRQFLGLNESTATENNFD